MLLRRTLLVAFSISCVVGVGSPGFGAEYRPTDIQECIQALYSNDQEDRAAAGERLSEMGAEAKSAVPRLIEILESDPIMSVRGEAAKALGNIGKPAAVAVPALIAFVKNLDGGIESAYAATALGNIGAQPETSVPALTAVLQSEDAHPTVRQLAARALGDFGAQASPAVPALIAAIKTGNKELRDAAASALIRIPASARDVPALTEMLTDDITVARAAAVKALAGAGSEAAGAVPTLIKMLTDSDNEVRSAAVHTLGSIGKDARPAVPYLRIAAKNDATLKPAVDEAIASIKAAR